MASLPLPRFLPKLSIPSSCSTGKLTGTGIRPARRTSVRCNSRLSDRKTIFQVAPSIPHCEDYLHTNHLDNLKKISKILSSIDDPLESIITIDSLQRMGIDYHFKEEIGVILDFVYEKFGGSGSDHTGNLFEAALFFRLLRQARYPVSVDVFNKFLDKRGRFESSLSRDTRGMLCLYEASHLNKGEDMLYMANEFSRNHLNSSINYLEPDYVRIIRHAMEHPNHMSLQRYNARHYLSHCQSANGMDGFLYDIARSDFNIIQSLHQRELKEVSRWWKNLGLAQELRFARDQPVKWYLWSMATIPDPQFSLQRIKLAKVISFIYIIDDIFDVYGSLDELCLFTEAINKWDISAIDSLPTYMRICYMALYNITNQIAQIIFEEKGWDPINSLKKMWTTLCKAFLQEAKWSASNHVPLVDEYFSNGVISSGVHVVLVHMYFLLEQGLTKENVDLIESNPALLSCPAKILRLWDDLGSAKDENQEGFDGSYVECYVKENPSCSTQSARDHVMNVISNTWENLNKECFSPSPFSTNFVTGSLNCARMVKVMYSYDDNKRLPILEEFTNSLLFESL